MFRYERIDASHEHTFHQVEGLMIERELSVANLIYSMKTLLEAIFEREVTIRLRPDTFPSWNPASSWTSSARYVEETAAPSVSRVVGLSFSRGLVHPDVLRHGGLDPNEWSGWAFGLGLSRLVMMKYQVEDIRHLMGADLRFISQFRKG